MSGVSRRALLGAAVAAVAARPFRAARAAGRPSVTFINPGKTGEVFWDMVSATMRAAAAQLDVELEILTAERDRIKMRDLGVAAASRTTRPDYLIVVNEDLAATDILIAAERNAVPTLIVSNPLTREQEAEVARAGPLSTGRTSQRIGSLLCDHAGAGARMGAALVAAARRLGLADRDGRIHMLAIGGNDVTPASVQRLIGLRRALAGTPDVTLDRIVNAEWNGAQAEAITRGYLEWSRRAGTRPGAIWAANDPMALGALTALEEIGRVGGKDCVVAGLNWSRQAIESIKAGRMVMTDGGHFFLGGFAIVMVRDHYDGPRAPEPDRIVQCAMAPLDAEGVRHYEAAFPQDRFDNVDFNRFRRNDGAGSSYAFDVATVFSGLKSGGGL